MFGRLSPFLLGGKRPVFKGKYVSFREGSGFQVLFHVYPLTLDKQSVGDEVSLANTQLLPDVGWR